MTSDDVSQSREIQGTLLLVEDNFLVAVAMRAMVESLGWQVVGPVGSVDEGVKLAEGSAVTGALLDINIIGGTSAPIAEALRKRGCPFIFVTGYASGGMLPESLSREPRLPKPVSEEVLDRAMRTVFGVR